MGAATPCLQDIVIGRYRDAQDRIAWLLAHRRFEEALSLAEADRSLPATLYEAAVQSYLEHLTASPGGWAAAAQQLPRLLKDRAHLWERWVFSFAQARQLPVLAGVLPVKRPQLRGQTYEMLLAALLLDPVHHPELLALVQVGELLLSMFNAKCLCVADLHVNQCRESCPYSHLLSL